MSSFSFSARVTSAQQLACTLRNHSSAAYQGFQLGLSLVTGGVAVSGCRLTRQVGGYCEVAPEPEGPLAPGATWEFVLAYHEAGYVPFNQSWGPQGVHLLTAQGEALPVEAHPLEFPDVPPFPQLDVTPEAPELPLIPHPESWKPTGTTCSLASGITVLEPLPFPDVPEAVDALARRCGFSPLQASSPSACPLTLHQDASLGLEAYWLEIHPDRLELGASGRTGALYGGLTLLQLAEATHRSLPCGRLEDQPRFSWRGQHLDCARHFYEVDTLLRVLDLMALLKLNRFHWHLIDDEAFRLELEGFPELAAQTSARGHGCVVPGVFGGGAGPTGRAYSAADVERVRQHAQTLGIEVMPEVEIPAHAWALLQVFPELRDPEDTSHEVSVQCYAENAINPGRAETWRFLEKLLPEVHQLFPDGWIHLGCDELPPGTWERSPAVARLKAEHGLHTTEDVQEWTMQRAAALLQKAGARVAAWEEAARGQHGGIGPDTLLFSWTGQGPGLDAARRGYSVVMCPAPHTYFDLAQTAHPSGRGINWAGTVGLRDALEWQPVPPEEPELEARIQGVQGQLWSETILDDRMVEALLAPRILALAEVAWCPEARKRAFPEFVGAAQAFLPLLSKMNWESHPLV